MTFNLLWLLTPLGCLLIAIFVPHHLTMAIQSIDVLTTSNPQASAYEKGMLRSIVQEIVDLKLKSLQEEMVVLRNTIVSQEREVEGIRLLYESLRAVNDDTQQKMNVVDNTSVLSIHIEHVVSKHAETLVCNDPDLERWSLTIVFYSGKKFQIETNIWKNLHRTPWTIKLN